MVLSHRSGILTNRSGMLARQIVRADEGSWTLALQIADHMAIRDIRNTLEEVIAPHYPELCHRFIQQWLPRLDPIQRLAAALEVGHFYALDLAQLPDSQVIGLSQILSAGSTALESFKDELVSYRDVAIDPGTVIDLKFVKRMEARTQLPLSTIIGDVSLLVAELEELQRRNDEDHAVE
ncbi:hypothetical protein [Brevibacterium linens]|uniref:hypothetical protein n=1 Tax=Brevibacterium linens TaxID=1703 RepID=UPI003BF581CC